MKKILIILIVIMVLFAGWKLASPLFIDNAVDEELPEEFANFVLPTEEEFNSMSEEEKEEMEIKMVEVFSDQETIVDEKMDEMNSPKLVVSGQFADADNFHKGSGLAKVLTQNNLALLRFEDFEVTNGPDLHVLLSKNSNPSDSDDLGEYIDLGKLKGNVGNQNYEIPEGVDISDYSSVVIYCKPFHVVFSVADLN